MISSNLASSLGRIVVLLAFGLSGSSVKADPRMSFHNGNGAAWSPLFLGSNLAGWFDSRDYSTMFTNTGGTTAATIGSTVALWKDKSGHHYDATQATVSQQATLTRAGLVFGGNTPATTYTSTMTISNLTATNKASFFVAFNVSSSNSYYSCITCFRGNGNTGIFSANSTFSVDWWTDSLYNWGTGATEPTNSPSVAGFVNLGSSQLVSVNGTTATYTSTSSTITAGTTTQLIFGRDSGYSDRFFFGTISEVVLVSNDLSTANRQKLEGYLAWKWGSQASLASGHPYKNYAP